MNDPVISMHDLRVSLGGRVILGGLDLEVRDSEIIVVVGPSGCGKSTLLRVLSGLLHATAGTLRIDGKGVQGPSFELGVVFQEDALLPWRTVLANVELPLAIRGVNRRVRRDRALSMLTDVGLRGCERQLPGKLSGGMRQRVQIARALVGTPRVLLMDEPFGALDARTRSAAQDVLLEAWRRHRCTVVFVTHDVDEALRLADRIVVMSREPGRIRAVLDVPSARQPAAGRQVAADLRAEVLRLLDEAP
jgi:NitT/TauT family transport system ATP-binding protein